MCNIYIIYISKVLINVKLNFYPKTLTILEFFKLIKKLIKVFVKFCRIEIVYMCIEKYK